MEEQKRTGFKTPLKFLSITRTSSSDRKVALPKISDRSLGKRLSIPVVMSEKRGNNSHSVISESKDDTDQVIFRNSKVTTPSRPLSVCIPSTIDPKTRWRSQMADLRYPLLGRVSSEGVLNSNVSRDVNSNIEEKPKTDDKDIPSEVHNNDDEVNTTENEINQISSSVSTNQDNLNCASDLLSLEKHREYDITAVNSVPTETGYKFTGNNEECHSKTFRGTEIGITNLENKDDFSSKKPSGNKIDVPKNMPDKPIFYGVVPVCSKEKAVSLHPKREINLAKNVSPQTTKQDMNFSTLESCTSQSQVNAELSFSNDESIIANKREDILSEEGKVTGNKEEINPVEKEELPPARSSPLNALKMMSKDCESGIVFSPRTRALLIENENENQNNGNLNVRSNISLMSRSEKLRKKVQSLYLDEDQSFKFEEKEKVVRPKSQIIPTSDSILDSVLTVGNANKIIATEEHIVPKITSNDLCTQGQKDKMTLNFNDQGRPKKEEPLSPIDTILTSPTRPARRRPSKRRYYGQKSLEEDEFIGFASLPEQVHRKAVRRGFDFSLMVLGDSGLGKSTLINSLFLTDLYKDRTIPDTADLVERTLSTVKKQIEIEEKGVKVRLTIVDTPGYNDAVNAEDSWKRVVSYVDQQFQLYYQAESGLNRKNINDSRIHCCLYFISPYGHGLKPLDILVMKKLHNKVNIVPLIAKSDVLTPKEVKRLKTKVLEDIRENDINIYTFPECDSDEDDEFKEQDKALKEAVPFAVIGSNTVVEAGGKKIRGRMYPWGIVEVDNPKHCDFIKLRQMLISTHMQDLKDITSEIHYENYRNLCYHLKSQSLVERGRN
ncbi:SEPT4 [Mytilus coruscus]|uniref:SEPT4 n=1 Tax=Mytilus coruscus TaxID=42192 RepID=A0A6J8BS55_MYTCO|nr:SEPT4 [Mytilus coruscus]